MEDKNYILSNIPKKVLELLWIKENAQENHISELDNEPSCIILNDEIDNNISEYDISQNISYYPNYHNITAKQRYIYLKWLEDITKPIQIGYVFMFYYGLERHLLYGEFEKAFEMVNRLRIYHNNNSFNAYSADALLISALYHKKIDLLQKVDINKASPNISLFVTAFLAGRIEIEELIGISKDVGFTNQRYIKNNLELFKSILKESLINKFGVPFYPVSEEDIKECKTTFPIILANYSLKMEERIANAPHIISNKKIKENIFQLLTETHNKIKCQNKTAKKSQKVEIKKENLP